VSTDANNLAELGTDSLLYVPTAHNHAGSEITSGTVPFARLPVGTGSSQVSQGDHAHAGGGGYDTVAFERTVFASSRTSSGTTKTLFLGTGHPVQVGDVVTVAGTGGTGYTGTFTISSVASTTITYTGSASSTETGVACAGQVIVYREVTARSDLLLSAPGGVAVDATTATRLIVPGAYPTPASTIPIGPLTSGASFTNSYTEYQGEKSCPVYIPEAGLVFNTVRAQIQASSSAGVVRFGIRQSNLSGECGQLVADFGTTGIIGFGVPFAHSLSISWTAPAAGLYWLVLSFQTSSAGSPGATEATMLPVSHLSPAFTGTSTFGKGAGTTTGALALAGPGTAGTNPTRCPIIQIIRA
jgi:hypothetical protein